LPTSVDVTVIRARKKFRRSSSSSARGWRVRGGSHESLASRVNGEVTSRGAATARTEAVVTRVRIAVRGAPAVVVRETGT